MFRTKRLNVGSYNINHLKVLLLEKSFLRVVILHFLDHISHRFIRPRSVKVDAAIRKYSADILIANCTEFGVDRQLVCFRCPCGEQPRVDSPPRVRAWHNVPRLNQSKRL
jgi:hypothetical protein